MTASPRKTLPAPCLNMVSRQLILPAIPELMWCQNFIYLPFAFSLNSAFKMFSQEINGVFSNAFNLM
jgi:hypothetical protein